MEKILAAIKIGSEEDIANGIIGLEECTQDTIEMLVREAPSPRISSVIKEECQKRLLKNKKGITSRDEVQESESSVAPQISTEDALDKCKFGNSKYDKALGMFFNSFKANIAGIDNLRAAKLSHKIVRLVVDNLLDSFPKAVRSKSHNLRENFKLCAGIYAGDIAPEDFVKMTTAEMQSDDLKSKDNEYIKDSLLASQMASVAADTDMFKCSRCKQRKCTYAQLQTRSCDEPMTTFVTCTVCGNRWKF